MGQKYFFTLLNIHYRENVHAVWWNVDAKEGLLFSFYLESCIDFYSSRASDIGASLKCEMRIVVSRAAQWNSDVKLRNNYSVHA